MTTILVATDSGCRVFTERGEARIELAGRRLKPLASHVDGTCIAIVDEKEVWRVSSTGHGGNSRASTSNSSRSVPAGTQSTAEE